MDEADAMTIEAQKSLRTIIEKFSASSRFCLICNYIKKIDIALQSRCVCFKFSPIDNIFMVDKINYVVNAEKININSGGIDEIIKINKLATLKGSI